MLVADTAALKSGVERQRHDLRVGRVEDQGLGAERDALATRSRTTSSTPSSTSTPIPNGNANTAHCNKLQGRLTSSSAS